jgi:hypothetical protein
MARLGNQDAALCDIRETLKPLVAKVAEHDAHVHLVRRVVRWGSTVAATGVGAYLIKIFGWK